MKERLTIILCLSALVLLFGVSVLGDEANFVPSTYNPAVGEGVVFEVCQTCLASEADHYEWDFDGDGFYEVTTDVVSITQVFTEPGYIIISLRIVDTHGRELTHSKGILIGESSLFAVREATTEGDGMILVRITLSAQAEVRAVGLEEIIPRGWQVEVIDPGNTISKKEGENLYFLWMNPIYGGEMWTIIYRLYPSYGVGSPTLSGSVSGYGEEGRLRDFVCGDATVIR
jgi:PKD repeat protein